MSEPLGAVTLGWFLAVVSFVIGYYCGRQASRW
jgi:hypothetical protein